MANQVLQNCFDKTPEFQADLAPSEVNTSVALKWTLSEA